MPLIAVADLKVGMYVQLDLGWLDHPFPLSSFRIASDDQIATLRSLGLQEVRWSPERSDAPANAETRDAQPVLGVAPAAGPTTPPVNPEREARRAALAAQRQQCAQAERQYAEAMRALKLVNDKVVAAPLDAKALGAALARALLDKMLVDRDLNIRLLTESAGERAGAHALNVTVISMLMGRVFGFGDDEMLDLGLGALMHDIGKIDLPDRVRNPDEHASAAELALYREHVAHGVAHARRMGLTAGSTQVIAQHHEHADGSGFPQRLSLARLSAAARLVALVNRYDNLCNPVQATRALTPHEALSLLFAQGRGKFDTTMLNAFIRMMGVYPPGSLVELTDGRFAMVMAVNSSRPLRPRVLVHDARTPQDEALWLNLESETDLGIRRSLKATQLPAAAQGYLAPRSRVAYFFDASDRPEPTGSAS